MFLGEDGVQGVGAPGSPFSSTNMTRPSNQNVGPLARGGLSFTSGWTLWDASRGLGRWEAAPLPNGTVGV